MKPISCKQKRRAMGVLIILWLAGAGCLGVAEAASPAAGTLSLGDCIVRALESNPYLKLAERSWALVQERYHQDVEVAAGFSATLARQTQDGLRGPHPGFSAVLRVEDLDISVGVAFSQAGSRVETSPQVIVGFSKALFGPGAVSELRDRLAFLQGRATYLAARRDLVVSVVNSFIDLLQAECRVRNARLQLRAAEESLKQVKAEVDAGRKAESSIIDARDALAAAERELDDSKQAYARSKQALARIVTMEVDDIGELLPVSLDVVVDESLIEMSMETATETALTARSDVEIARLQAEISRGELKAAEYDAGWRTVLSASYCYPDENNEHAYEAAVRIEKSLYNPGQELGLEEKRIASDRARLSEESLRVQVRHEVEDAYRAMRYAEGDVSRAERDVIWAEKRLTAAQTDYRHGLLTTRELDRMKEDVETQRLKLAVARLVRLRAQLQWLSTMGMDPADILEAK